MAGDSFPLTRRARGIARRIRGLRTWAELPADVREALIAVGENVAREHVAARRSPTIAPDARISPLASLRFTERVEIGSKATVGPWCCVWGGWSVTWARVGTGALLSPGVVLVAGNHGIDGTGPIRDQPFVELDVSVGDGAWIGANSTIVGCRVGDGAVVGAGSVVTSDIPDLAIAVGSPARVVGYRTPVEVVKTKVKAPE